MVFGLSFLVLAVVCRSVALQIVQAIYRRADATVRVMIYGAGQTGQQLAAALKTDDEFECVCFVDDNIALQKLAVNGAFGYLPATTRRQ